jgi:hypothetical protein
MSNYELLAAYYQRWASMKPGKPRNAVVLIYSVPAGCSDQG